MDDVLRMHVGDRVDDLIKDLAKLLLGLNAAAGLSANILVKIVAVDVFDDDRDFLVVVDTVVELHDAWMVKSHQRVALLAQGVDPLSVLDELFLLVLLDGNHLLGCPAHRPLDDAEGALPNQTLDIVVLNGGGVVAVEIDVIPAARSGPRDLRGHGD